MPFESVSFSEFVSVYEEPVIVVFAAFFGEIEIPAVEENVILPARLIVSA